MDEAWSCAKCSSTNFASSIVCWNCGTARPEQPAPPADDAPTEATAADDGAARAGEAFPYSPPSGTTAPSEKQSPSWQAGGSAGAWPAATETPADGATTAAPDDTTGAPPVSGWVPPSELQAQPSGPIPLWRRIPIGWLILLVFIVGGAAAGWYFSAGRGSEGEITKAGDLEAKDLRVGDCFDLKEPGSETIEDVTAVPCSKEHEFELFFAGSMPEGTFPGDQGFKTYVQANCFPAFASYVGTAYDDSDLDVYWLQPTDKGWGDGDRSVQCAVYHPRIHRLTNSLKGSNQ
jgi:putative regulator of septum formation